jgi:hypothetical protein
VQGKAQGIGREKLKRGSEVFIKELGAAPFFALE